MTQENILAGCEDICIRGQNTDLVSCPLPISERNECIGHRIYNKGFADGVVKATESCDSTFNSEIEETKKEGMREVVEWIETHSQIEKCDRDTMAYFGDYLWVDNEDWQTFLKEKEL